MERLFLDEINKEISSLKNKIQLFAEQLEFKNSEEFILTDRNEKELLADFKSAGIYFFEIKTNGEKSLIEWKNDFIKRWDNIEHSPNLIKKRAETHKELKDWMPLYIGKRKDLKARVNQHLTLKKDSTTVGMKLCARKNLWGKKFRVSIIQIDTSEENYDIIMPIIEFAMRKKYKPIIGKQ